MRFLSHRDSRITGKTFRDIREMGKKNRVILHQKDQTHPRTK
jgi:hypothetical protein